MTAPLDSAVLAEGGASAPGPAEPASSVLDWLRENAPRMGFVAVVSLLERLMKGGARIGEGPFADEPVWLRHDPALSFSAGDVSGLLPRQLEEGAGPPVELTTTFLGLTGAVGPLPSYFAEEIAQEDGAGSRRDFLDIFHHRLLSLLYRGLQKYQLASDASTDGGDAWARRLLALMGFDAYVAPPPLAIAALLRLAPQLVGSRRTGRGLELLVEELLSRELAGVQVEVIPFAGRWADIDPSQRFRLGRANHRLGAATVLGQRVFERANAFTLRIGPLAHADCPRLMPGGDLHRQVVLAVACFAGEALEFDLELVLTASPPFTLSRRATTRLGRDTWLGSAPGRGGVVRASGSGAPLQSQPSSQL